MSRGPEVCVKTGRRRGLIVGGGGRQVNEKNSKRPHTLEGDRS